MLSGLSFPCSLLCYPGASNALAATPENLFLLDWGQSHVFDLIWLDCKMKGLALFAPSLATEGVFYDICLWHKWFSSAKR